MAGETKPPAGETKPRQAGPERKAKLAEKNYWDDLLALRDQQREQIRTGLQVVKETELPLESNRQGLMRWYMHPSIKDTALSTMVFFQQEIPPGSRSGRIKFQGGQVILVLEGKGYSRHRRREACVGGRRRAQPAAAPARHHRAALQHRSRRHGEIRRHRAELDREHLRRPWLRLRAA